MGLVRKPAAANHDSGPTGTSRPDGEGLDPLPTEQQGGGGDDLLQVLRAAKVLRYQQGAVLLLLEHKRGMPVLHI